MFKLVFSPYSKYLVGKIFKHKYFEFGYSWGEKRGFEIHWRFSTTGDHAGFRFDFSIYKLFFEFVIYDNRHWDYKKHCWKKMI